MKHLFRNLALLLLATFPRMATAQTCCSGEGTEARPFTISSAAELADLAVKVNTEATSGTYSNKYYRLNNDIDLSSYANWTPIAKELSTGGAYAFRGVFDGDNKKITGLKISGTGRYLGLFGYISDGSVKNLSLENVNISGEGAFTGGLAGIVNNATVSNCSVTGTVTGINNVGGIAGYVDGGTISQSYSTSDVTGSGGQVGGIAGSINKNASITNCYATGSVKGYNFIGGIAGYLDSNSTITKCYATGTVAGSYSGAGNELAVVTVGGIVGTATNSTVSQSAALNCAVQHLGTLGTGFGRVYGWNISSNFSGNVAFDEMRVAVNLADPAEAKDLSTSLKTVAELQTASGFPAGLTQAPWTYESGKFPGFGAAIDIGNHFSYCEGISPIRLPQIAASNINIKSANKTIVLENMPQNAKIDVYNMQGKRIYLGNSENSQILRIPIQTKGIYVIKVTSGSKREMQRVVVK